MLWSGSEAMPPSYATVEIILSALSTCARPIYERKTTEHVVISTASIRSARDETFDFA